MALLPSSCDRRRGDRCNLGIVGFRRLGCMSRSWSESVFPGCQCVEFTNIL